MKCCIRLFIYTVLWSILVWFCGCHSVSELLVTLSLLGLILWKWFASWIFNEFRLVLALVMRYYKCINVFAHIAPGLFACKQNSSGFTSDFIWWERVFIFYIINNWLECCLFYLVFHWWCQFNDNLTSPLSLGNKVQSYLFFYLWIRGFSSVCAVNCKSWITAVDLANWEEGICLLYSKRKYLQCYCSTWLFAIFDKAFERHAPKVYCPLDPSSIISCTVRLHKTVAQ